MAKKQRKIEKMEDFKRSELIHIIRVYNKHNIIKNYHKKNKNQLIDAINEHIILSEDYKKVSPKPNETKLISVTKYKELKDENLLNNKEKNLNKLYKQYGNINANLMKLRMEKKQKEEELKSDKRLNDDPNFKEDMKNINDDIKIYITQLNKIKNQIKKIDTDSI